MRAFDKPQKPLRTVLLIALLLAAHALVFVAVDTVLGLNRFAAVQQETIHAALIEAPQVPKSPAPKSPTNKAPKETAPESAPESAPAQLPPSEPLAEQPVQPPAASNAPMIALPEPAPHAPHAPHAPPTQANPSESPKPLAQKHTQPERFDAPPAVRWRYVLTKDGDSAKAEIVWQPSSTGYVLTQEAFKFGFSALKHQSEGSLTALGLLPKRFSDKRFRRSELAAHFERDATGAGQVIFSNNRPSVALKPQDAAQDRVSVILQLVGWFRANAQLGVAGTVLEIPVASAEELQVWRFEVMASEADKTSDTQTPRACKDASGAMPMVHLKRSPRRAFDQTVELWLASNCGFAPVRTRLIDSAGVTEMQLIAFDAP